MENNILPGPVEAGDIEKYLPHRYPFLLIDRVLEMQLEPDKRLIGVKNVSVNEPFFTGHFPGNPVMPGVLMIEAMAQAAGMLAHLWAEITGEEDALFFLARVDNTRFSQIVLPGDQLVMEVVETRRRRLMGWYSCETRVDGKVVASCNLVCSGQRE